MKFWRLPIFRKVKNILLLIVIVAIAIFFSLFTTLDRTPMQSMPYYKNMKAKLDSITYDSLGSIGSPVKVGWSSISIVPQKRIPLAGYGVRPNFDCVHDSLFVKTFCFENNKKTVYMINIDLMIFPPKLVEMLMPELTKLGISMNDVYLSASHTHSAPGGWAKILAGKVMAGGYDKDYMLFLKKCVLSSIQEAKAKVSQAQIGFTKINAHQFVRNRLGFKDNKTDPWIRVLKITNKNKQTAILYTYSAHANCIGMHNTCLSDDYIHYLNKNLNPNKVQFAAYFSGMVGSHIPQMQFNEHGQEVFEYELSEKTGIGLARLINEKIDSIPMKQTNVLWTTRFPLYLREPHLKISQDFRMRPWLFKYLFGTYTSEINAFRIDSNLFVGTPCDFSGEIMYHLYEIEKKKKINLNITSFNGSYIGYVNVDRYYDDSQSETRHMNWFGPYNEAYFTEIMKSLVNKMK